MALPKVWVGYIIAAFFVVVELLEAIQDPTLRNTTPWDRLIYLLGVIYWLYWIYRLHQVIAAVTNSSHPITPRQAAGYNIIPVYNIYWFFKWTNEVTNFVNNRLSSRQMAKGWAGFFLLIGFLLGAFVDGGIGLAVIFSVGGYLVHKIRLAIPFPEEGHLNHWGQIKLALRTAMGSVCFMIIFYWAQDFFKESWQKRADSLLAIFLVFLIIVVFLEPVTDMVRKFLGIHPQHEAVPQGKGFLRILTILIVIATGVLHGVIHEKIQHNPLVFATQTIVAFFIAGGITYSWTVGTRRRPFRAKWLGAVCGFLVGVLILPLICKIFTEKICLTPTAVFVFTILGNGLFWGLAGFAGGWGIDRGWGARPIMIVLILFGAILVVNFLPLFYLYYLDPNLLIESAEMLGWSNMYLRALFDLVKVLGWGFGLWADPHACELLGGECRDSAVGSAYS
jgi:hypothetical protein